VRDIVEDVAKQWATLSGGQPLMWYFLGERIDPLLSARRGCGDAVRISPFPRDRSLLPWVAGADHACDGSTEKGNGDSLSLGRLGVEPQYPSGEGIREARGNRGRDRLAIRLTLHATVA